MDPDTVLKYEASLAEPEILNTSSKDNLKILSKCIHRCLIALSGIPEFKKKKTINYSHMI